MNNRRKAAAVQTRKGDVGAVLVTVLLVMLALVCLGVTALWMTSGNLQIGANANMRNQALYVAEAGVEAVRADLNGATARVLGTLLAGGMGGTYDNVPTGTAVDATTGQPNGFGAVYFYANGTVLRDVAFPPASFARGTGTTPMSTTMGTYTVWIRNDTAELRQHSTAPLGTIVTDTNGVVVVRSRGLATDGRTQVVLEVTMSPGLGGAPAVFCYGGKNACDDNSSTMSGVYSQ